MQKKNRFYTVHLPQFFNKNNKINRLDISKNLFHFFAVVSILGVVAVSVGFLKNTVFAKPITENVAQTEIVVQPAAQAVQKAEYKSISYDRPAESEIDISYDGEAAGYTLNTATAGASAAAPTTTNAGNSQLESQIQTIMKTSSPAFLPTLWAHFGKINNEFGFRRNPFGGASYEFHPGLDIDGETGDAIIAPANGVVVKAERRGGYGNMIEIDHGNGLTTRYGHLSRIDIAAGSAVQRGQFIGLVGSTGRSTGAHLHFEVRLNDKPINPRRFLSSGAPIEIARLQAR